MENDTADGVLEHEKTLILFHWFDYVVFAIMLAVSTAIGVFFGCFGNKQAKTVDYLLGGKTMSVIPVGVSLVASYVSGIAIIGAPSEVYMNGTSFWFSVFGLALMGIIINYVFLPVFYELQLISTFEYLERRFNAKIRVMASILNTLSMILLVPIVVYIPTLTLSSVTGLSVHIINPIICIICIFYTMVGGLKAVIWTDCVQGLIIFASCIVVIIMGFIQVGGFGVVWERVVVGDRLQSPILDVSPLNRNSVWAVVIGTLVHCLSIMGIRQGFVVKYLSLPTLDKARSALLFMVIGIAVMHTVVVIIGLLIFASYSDCDPLTTKTIQRADQLLPLYVMDLSSSIPGFPGVFIAGVFSASLSTMSICLNALAGNIYEDFIRPYCMTGAVSEHRVNLILKSIVVGIGTLCVLMVFVVAELGDVFELTISSSAITSGALLGLFALGVFFPTANTKGALAGSIASMLFVGWLVIGSQLAMKNGSLRYQPLPASVEGCAFNATVLPETETTEPPEPPFILYRIAFYYFSVIGTVIVITVGMGVSYFTESKDPATMELALFAPFLHKYIQRKKDATVQPAERELLNMKTVGDTEKKTDEDY